MRMKSLLLALVFAATAATARSKAFIPPDMPLVPLTGRCVALVVGNSNYRNVAKLETSGTDAEAIAQALRSIGFVVDLKLDADATGLDLAMQELRKQASNSHIAVVFVSGHGVQIKGQDHFAATDATHDSGAVRGVVSFADLSAAGNGARIASIIIADVSRTDVNAATASQRGLLVTPLPVPGETVEVGLQGIKQATESRWMLFSTSPGMHAFEKSPFASTIAKLIVEKDMSFSGLARAVFGAMEMTGSQRSQLVVESSAELYLAGRSTDDIRPCQPD